MLIRTGLVLVLLASLSVAPAGAAPGEPAQPGRALSTPELLERAMERGRLNRATADLYLARALGDHRKLPDRFVSDVPWDGTLPLLRLQERAKRMPPGAARAALAEALNAGSCGGVAGGASAVSTPHFFIEYGTIQAGLTISEYAASLEASWVTEVDAFDWAAPPLPSTTPTPNRYHVVISNLGSGLYGFVSSSGTHAGFVGNNPNTPWNDADAFRSCMALNQDYSAFPSPPQASLDATTAHEFNHSIQFGYGAITGPNTADDVFVEGGATWIEDEVFDGANDNYFYLWPNFTGSMGEYTDSPYPYWVVFRALTERYGASVPGGGEQVMQDFWEAVSQNATSIDLDALDDALATKGTTLADAYHAAAVALKFTQACGPALAYPYCLEEGPDYVAVKGSTPVQGSIGSVGDSFSGSVRDNFALNWIILPATGAFDVTLENTSPAGQLRGTVACSNGSGLSVFALPAVAGTGASTTLVGFDPAGAGCSSAPVAVITNQSQTAPNPPTSTQSAYDLSTAAAAGASHPLGVTLGGTGSGTVTGSPAGIDCPDDCTEAYADATEITLTAAADPGSTFEGWGGPCSGAGEICDLEMTGATSVLATFQASEHPLTVQVGGQGTVTSAPAGIACPADCQESFPDGTTVTLTGTPAAGQTLATWAGNCSGDAATCELVMTGSRAATVIFEPAQQPVPSPKAVTLKAKPRKVDAGERTRLRAKVLPCEGHEGDSVQFFRKKKRIATKKSNKACVAKVKVRVPWTSVFRAVSPQQDEDHLKGTSKKVKVRVRQA
ncbi:MAG: InlB B-repeat-containing protein [Actinomycetota bacterium]